MRLEQFYSALMGHQGADKGGAARPVGGGLVIAAREAGGLDQEGGPGLRLGLGLRWSPQDFSRGEGEERRGCLGVWPEQLKGRSSVRSTR